MVLARLFIATLILVTAGVFTANAQSISIFGGPHTIKSSVTVPDVEGKLPVRNSGSEMSNIKVRMIVESKQEGQDLYFCWDQCFPPNITESGVVTIAPNDASDLFSAHINPNGVAGQAVVRFEFFIEGNPTEVTTARFIFDIENEVVDVEEYDTQLVGTQLASFPSPAVESVELSFVIPGSFSNAQLSVHNLFGNEVASMPITTSEGSTLLDVTAFNPGVYFYTLTIDNQRVQSKKFVIKR